MAKEKEKRSKPKIPIEYLEAVADRIHSTNPTKEIIYNTIKALWADGFGEGYLRRISDNAWFHNRRNARLKESFDAIMTNIDNEIHQTP